jgi:hypothetical protein
MSRVCPRVALSPVSRSGPASRASAPYTDRDATPHAYPYATRGRARRTRHRHFDFHIYKLQHSTQRTLEAHSFTAIASRPSTSRPRLSGNGAYAYGVAVGGMSPAAVISDGHDVLSLGLPHPRRRQPMNEPSHSARRPPALEAIKTDDLCRRHMQVLVNPRR